MHWNPEQVIFGTNVYDTNAYDTMFMIQCLRYNVNDVIMFMIQCICWCLESGKWSVHQWQQIIKLGTNVKLSYDVLTTEFKKITIGHSLKCLSATNVSALVSTNVNFP